MPDIITFNRLAEVLGVDLNYFSESFQSSATETPLSDFPAEQPTESPSGGQKKKRSWDMSREKLVDTDFSGLTNLHEKFSYSYVQRCLFLDSDLTKLFLKGNYIDGCDFRGSKISNSRFQRSYLINNRFNDCLLKEADFSESHIESCDFSGVDFTGAAFTSCSFPKNKLVNAVWNHTSFTTTAFADVVFEGTMEDCFFEDCGFEGVKFQHSTLVNTFFKNNRKLKRIEFVDCKVDSLTYAFLKNGKADLSGVTLLTL